MVPAWVAPFVRSPPSSPAEVANAPGALTSARRYLPQCSLRQKPSLVPTITVYVPVVGAFVATCTAEAPAELVATSSPVGGTRRIQGFFPSDTGAPSPLLSFPTRRSSDLNDH